MSLVVRTIVRKRDGAELSEGEIQDFVAGVTAGTVTDEQAAALLMAICCRGMTTAETAALTFAMMNSGETWDLSKHGFVADKHSTGGVGDKSTLVLAPLLAACGVKTGMMSGRGLGHTGGTLDKLEAIPGFVTGQSREAFDRLLETVGCALIAATDTVAPAGVAVGNANEVEESIRLLRGDGPADLRENVLLLGADLLVAAGVAASEKEARKRLNVALQDGTALETFARVVAEQGGNPAVCDDLSLLPQPVAKHEVKAAAGGTIRRVATRELGLLSIEIGCGRARKDDVVDPASGFRVLRRPGDPVLPGDPLLVVELGPKTGLPAGYLERVAACFEVGPAEGADAPLPFVVEKL